MRWQYFGNFDPENSTENHVAAALRRNGHEVVLRQENDLGAWRLAANEMAGFDVTLWTRTGWEPALPKNLQRLVLQAGERHGVPIVGYHLDRWWGLSREPQVKSEVFFRCPLVVTADGGHDDEWRDAGVSHLWLPPAVLGAQAEEPGSYREDFDVPVAFVGSWREYHAEWAYRGRLVRWLIEALGDDFRVWEGGVRGRDLADLYATVDVIVGDSCLAGGATRYWSDRIPETVGRGGLLVHPDVEGLTDHFQPGEHLVTYPLGDFDALHDTIRELLADRDRCARIREQGRAHVLAHHTYERRMVQLVAELEDRGWIRSDDADAPAVMERPLRVRMDLVPVAKDQNLIDVLWLVGSGWWDQGLIDRLLEGAEWTPPGGYEFIHHHDPESLEDETRGAVVVAPGRFLDVATVQGIIDRLGWVLLIVTSDEEVLFPWWELTHPRMRVWAQEADRDGCVPLPIGFAHDTPAEIAALSPGAPDKTLDWAFAGQVTHERRQEAAGAMRALTGGMLVETSTFIAEDEGLARPGYLAMLAQAKLAPCPAGPESPETFRAWEALEAGAVPILDAWTPRRDRPDYWRRLLRDAPIPVIEDWSHLSAVAAELLADWPRPLLKAQQWWLEEKRRLAWRLNDDLADLTGGRAGVRDLADLVTVVVPTSPIPTHPDLGVIEATIASVRERLPDAEVIVACDGIRPEQDHLRGAYGEYLRRLLWACGHGWRNVLPVVSDRHVHQANVTRLALERVRTPLILFVEHDTPLVGDPLPWDGLARAVLTGVANVVRFHHESRVLPDHDHLMLDREPVVVEGVPMLRTIQWSQRPHLASTEFYRSMLGRWFPETSRTMIEDRVHSVAQRLPWETTRLWLYAPEGVTIQRSGHLDGRGDEPKFEMVYR